MEREERNNLLWKQFDIDSYYKLIDLIKDSIARGDFKDEHMKKQAERLVYLLATHGRKNNLSDGTSVMYVEIFYQTCRDLIDSLLIALISSSDENQALKKRLYELEKEKGEE